MYTLPYTYIHVLLLRACGLHSICMCTLLTQLLKDEDVHSQYMYMDTQSCIYMYCRYTYMYLPQLVCVLVLYCVNI